MDIVENASFDIEGIDLRLPSPNARRKPRTPPRRVGHHSSRGTRCTSVRQRPAHPLRESLGSIHPCVDGIRGPVSRRPPLARTRPRSNRRRRRRRSCRASILPRALRRPRKTRGRSSLPQNPHAERQGARPNRLRNALPPRRRFLEAPLPRLGAPSRHAPEPPPRRGRRIRRPRPDPPPRVRQRRRQSTRHTRGRPALRRSRRAQRQSHAQSHGAAVRKRTSPRTHSPSRRTSRRGQDRPRAWVHREPRSTVRAHGRPRSRHLRLAEYDESGGIPFFVSPLDGRRERALMQMDVFIPTSPVGPVVIDAKYKFAIFSSRKHPASCDVLLRHRSTNGRLDFADGFVH